MPKPGSASVIVLLVLVVITGAWVKPASAIPTLAVRSNHVHLLQIIFEQAYMRSGLSDANLRIGSQPETGEDSGDFQTEGWHHALNFKMDWAIGQISELLALGNHEQYVCVTDLDIQFFPSAPAAIRDVLHQMHERQLDFMFMREALSQEVNGGLYFARVGNASISLLRRAKAATEAQRLAFADQTAINALLLSDKDIKWDFIPAKYCLYGPIPYHWPKDITSAAFHHAVWGHNVVAKAQQMLDVAKTVFHAQRTFSPI